METWATEAVQDMLAALDLINNPEDRPTKGVLRVPQWLIDEHGIDAVQAEANEIAIRYGFPDGATIEAYNPWA